jgi:hypothetical protein
MYTSLAAEIIRRETARAARVEQPPRRPPRPSRALRRRLAEALRRSADRLAPEC